MSPALVNNHSHSSLSKAAHPEPCCNPDSLPTVPVFILWLASLQTSTASYSSPAPNLEPQHFITGSRTPALGQTLATMAIFPIICSLLTLSQYFASNIFFLKNNIITILWAMRHDCYVDSSLKYLYIVFPALRHAVTMVTPLFNIIFKDLNNIPLFWYH